MMILKISLMIFFQPDPSFAASHMAIDGECIPAGPIQAHILPAAARVMVK